MEPFELKGVTKRMGDFSIRDLNFKIPNGYVTGFIGRNGSGKTTTIQLIVDIIKPNQGEISLFGAPNTDPKTKQRIGFVYDELYMYENFTINHMRSFIAPLYDTWSDRLFSEYLSEFDLPLKKKLKHFSKGMKMKTSLLFALAHDPDLLIMDEPTAGLDPIFRRELMDILQELMTDEKRTIFFSTHITTDLDRIADHIIFIDDGVIKLEKSMIEIEEEFHLIKGEIKMLDADIRKEFLGLEETPQGFIGLLQGDPREFETSEMIIEKASLEDIMYLMTREKR
ncbi:ABC transporter ATP-binding protein [Paraliobacillus zengyii]|uniref:ABC transporter ATP-binding protein n=1 Tax=Paraliobacillus zengyii TaxID=2213194 RepID=UPI000DD43311|nr:ABC transporter ATP-binding protein [Paraliobacillus zengyii]